MIATSRAITGSLSRGRGLIYTVKQVAVSRRDRFYRDVDINAS